MKDKIVQLMKSEGLTPSRLAEVLEIQPSGISHLVSGRNKPSFELLKKILRRFPNINPYWLLLDDDKMYCDSEPVALSGDVMESESNMVDAPAPGDLFSSISRSMSQPAEKQAPIISPIELNNTIDSSSKNEPAKVELLQVVLLYSDGSCRSYYTK